MCIFGLFSVEICSVQFKEHATKVQYSHSWSKVTLIDCMHLIQNSDSKIHIKISKIPQLLDFWLFWWFRIAGDGARAFGFSSSINFQHKTLNKCYSTGICCVQSRYDFMTLLLCSLLKDNLENLKLIGMTYAFKLFMYVNNLGSQVVLCVLSSRNKTRQ